MPREVCHIQVGQCGNQIGTKFWETIAQEHGLAPNGNYVGNDQEQLEKIDVYYHETDTGRFVPRACLVDMENSVLNHITQRSYGGMFRPKNILTKSEGAANNFYNGYYSETAMSLCDDVVECLRSEIERTECCQGFTFSHSSAGGTGSGLTLRIFVEAAELLEKTFAGNYFFTVFPSNNVSNTVLEPYNSACVIERLRMAQNVVCFDNEALYDICFKRLGLKTPTFADMNRLVSMVMAGNTASFRFSGQVNTDMNKLCYALRVIGGIHWYIPSFAPLCSVKTSKYKKVTVAELVRQMTSEENQMFQSYAPAYLANMYEEEKLEGRCFAYAALFRGNMCSQDVDEALAFLKGNQELENSLRNTIGYEERQNFVLESVKTCQKYFTRNPRPTFNAITNYAAPGFDMSVTYLRNTTQVKYKFLSILQQAMKMNATDAFTHWLEKDGNYPAASSFKPINEVIDIVNTYLAQMGERDTTGYPVAQTANDISKMMTNPESLTSAGTKQPAKAAAPAPAQA